MSMRAAIASGLAGPTLVAANPVRVVGVPGVTSLSLGRNSSYMQAGEIFKMVGGKIVSVEAMGAFLPYGTKSGWIE